MSDPELAVDGDWHAVPLIWHTDLDHGGRWWSLTTDQREWLWTNPDGAAALSRLEVLPGDSFVDAGGVEECFPGVRGVPDHGDAWSRVWEGSRLAAHVDTDHGRLTRSVSEVDGVIKVAYATAPNDVPRVDPGPTAPYTHAVHMLLEVAPGAEVVVPRAHTMAVLDHPEPPQQARAQWPTVDGTDLSKLGDEDGTATCVILRGLASDERPAEAYVVDGDTMLVLRWQSDDPRQAGMILWRNLGGWPSGSPYRSIGLEPLVEADGPTQWWLEVRAYERGTD